MLYMRGGANRRSLRGSVRVDDRWCCWREAALEPAPADAFEIEEVADIAAGHLDRSLARDGAALIGAAIVECRIGIAGDGSQWGRSCHLAIREGQGYLRIAGLTRNQVESSRCRRPERCIEGIVAHCIVLSVVPQRRDGIAVIIVHHGRAVGSATVCLACSRLHELVQQAAIHRLLLVGVVVV